VSAGQTLTLQWAAREIVVPAGKETPPPEEAAAGRTELRVFAVQFQYEDDTLRTRTLKLWTHPGRGVLLEEAVLPPGLYEPLPVKGSVELQAVALVDLSEGGARLHRRDGRTRLVLPEATSGAARHAVMRLYLDIAPSRAASASD